MDVSIIIVNWNTRDIIRDCLKSVYEQTKGISFEVIVIDNASSDGSVEMVKSEFYQVVLIENKQNRGFAAGVNQGIAVAKGRYALVLNSDTIVCDNAIEKTVQYADKHAEAAVVGCQVWENSDTIQMTCFRFPSVLNLFLHTFALNKIFKNNHFFGREWMLWWPRDSEREVEVVSGSFMLVRRNAIDDVGLMDESYFLYYEETDWCYRFAKGGWKILFWPRAKIIHVDGGSHSTNKNAVGMSVQVQKSLLIFFKKHYGMTHYLFARLILAANQKRHNDHKISVVLYERDSKTDFGNDLRNYFALGAKNPI
ncbi:N-acetylglucosaminyl-diphospho-decaprenol L-rhamnosyltransferase [subsurface metagenome]